MSFSKQGMKNHDIVPVELIGSIAALKHGGAFKCIQELLRNKLVKHDRKKYDGYTLNYLGYDYLALNALRHRNVIKGVGRQIGVGKESDVFIAVDGEETRQVWCRTLRQGFIRTPKDLH
jgi:RIO kinase 2